MLFNKYKTVISNFGYLSVLNALNIGLPLLSIPFLTNVIGKAHFGVYSYILVLVQSINVITQYGFQFSATKKISQNRDKYRIVEQLCADVMCARFIIASICVGIIFLFSSYVLNTNDRFYMFVTALGIVYGDVFIPTWLFQGMEKMKYVTIVNSTSKILFTILIFLIISQSSDYVYIMAFSSVGYLMAAVLSLILVRYELGFHFVSPILSNVFTELRGGISLFLSMVGIDLYRNINVLVLNFFVSDAAVGVYALAEKVIKASQSFITPISQALFPHVSYKVKTEGVSASINILRKSSILLLGLTFFVVLCVHFCGGILVHLVGKDFSEIAPLMCYMYPVLVFGCLNYLLGFVGLVNLGQQKFFFYSVFGSGTVAVALLLAFVPMFGVKVAAITMSVSEILLFVASVFKLMKLYFDEKK